MIKVKVNPEKMKVFAGDIEFFLTASEYNGKHIIRVCALDRATGVDKILFKIHNGKCEALTSASMPSLLSLMKFNRRGAVEVETGL